MDIRNRRGIALVAGLCAAGCAVALVGFVLADDPERTARAADPRVLRGYMLSQVELDRRGKNPTLVGIGSYIVNAQGGCNDCHTCPPYEAGHDPFEGGDGRINGANYLAGGTPFGPTLVSPNLTPDAETGLPGDLTYQQFRFAIRTGHDPEQPERILQVMPWPVYRNMLESDLRAVYEFLRAIPHAESGCVPPPES